MRYLVGGFDALPRADLRGATPNCDPAIVAVIHAVIDRGAFGELSTSFVGPAPPTVVRNSNSRARVVKRPHDVAIPPATILCPVQRILLRRVPIGPAHLSVCTDCNSAPTIGVTAFSSESGPASEWQNDRQTDQYGFEMCHAGAPNWLVSERASRPDRLSSCLEEPFFWEPRWRR